MRCLSICVEPLLITYTVVIIMMIDIHVAAQEGPGIVIAHPGQDVELLCTVNVTSTNEVVEWIVDHEGQHGVNALRNGILTGYSANGNNLIVENIMMNDGRNDSEYRCVIALRDTSTIQRENNRTILYVAGVPAMVLNVTVDDNTVNINGNNVALTLSWGEPFNNLDPIVNYTVSCSGDVTCPPDFTTTDNTTRSYTITNLTPMTNYTFSVVATNSIGSGEATALAISIPAIIPPTLAPTIDKVSGVTVDCSPSTLIVQCTAVWNAVTQGGITGYQVYYNGTMMNVNSSTTTLTFTAPSLPDGVFTGTVVVMVTATSILGNGPASDPAIAEIHNTSITDAVTVLSTPNATNELHSITVTCTIHPNSTADQCIVMTMANGRMTRTGTAPITNGTATVAVNGLQCEVTYTIIAGGTLNGDLIGPRSSHGAVTAGPCPVCPPACICEACDNNDNGAIIGAVVGAFCVVIIIMVITNIMVWIYCIRIRHHTGTSLELHGPTKDTINPAYHTITDDHSKRSAEEPVSYYEDVNKPPEVKMTSNPAYSVP